MNSSSRLQIDGLFAAFVENELLPGTGLDAAAWRHALEALLAEFTPRNAALLERRDELQALIDAWWRDRRGRDVSVEDQTAFLRDIGYLLPEPGDFIIGTAGVDPEIGAVAGPQLVVPVSNGRYALNATNARWGSLYDALYGTDALEPPTGEKGYDPARGEKVIAYGRSLLDQVAPLARGAHAEARGYSVAGGDLVVRLADGATTGMAEPSPVGGLRGDADAPAWSLRGDTGLR